MLDPIMTDQDRLADHAKVKCVNNKKVNFFGKKHKSAFEMSCCLYQSIESYFLDLKSQKKQQKMMKYILRCSQILENNDECKLRELLASEYFNKSLLLLVRNPEYFGFEDKKRIYTILRLALIDSQHFLNPPVNYTEQFLRQVNMKQLIVELFDKFEAMSFFVGNTLRIVSSCSELLSQILSVELLKNLFKHLQSNHFEIQSEIVETLNHIFLSKIHPTLKTISSKLLKEHAQECIVIFNQTLQSIESYSAIRMLLRTLYKILSDPVYHSYAEEYLKNIDNLKIILNFTANEDSGIKKEALLFLDLFINILEERKDEKLKLIFQKNYMNLINVIKSFNDITLEGEIEEHDKVDTNFLIHRLHTVSF